jgi:hypothetical protein
MMSEEKKWNFQLQDDLEIYIANRREYIWDWFDNHPEPENIDCHWFEINRSQIKDVKVYFADQVFDSWLVKITCKNARRAAFLSQLFYKTTCQMGITQILINKKLFLFTDHRF